MEALDPVENRLAGVLLGTALGDALGLPAEGLAGPLVERRFGDLDRFRLIGGTGFVSDDTEQAALVAQALVREPTDPVRCSASFRRSLVAWFLRLPFGIGWSTLRACLRASFGVRKSGVLSAGNGAAMRAAIVGAFFPHDPERRAAFGLELAQVTHTDARAVEAALFVAELTAECVRVGQDAMEEREALVGRASHVIREPELRAALASAVEHARRGSELDEAVLALGCSGYVVHTLAITVFCFLRYGGEPMAAIRAAIRAGGDTDTHAAIVGAWSGALHGASAFPSALVARIHDGPFGPTHLRALARALRTRERPPRWSGLGAMLRNLALYPVILAHGFRRLLPG